MTKRMAVTTLGVTLLCACAAMVVLRFGNPQWHKQIFIFQCYRWPGSEPRPYQYPRFNGMWRAWHENGQLSYTQPIQGGQLWTGPECFWDATGRVIRRREWREGHPWSGEFLEGFNIETAILVTYTNGFRVSERKPWN